MAKPSSIIYKPYICLHGKTSSICWLYLETDVVFILFFICPTFWGMFILVWIICGLICFWNFVCNISYFSIKSSHWAFQKLKHSQARSFHFLNCFASIFPPWYLMGTRWIPPMNHEKQNKKTKQIMLIFMLGFRFRVLNPKPLNT